MRNRGVVPTMEEKSGQRPFPRHQNKDEDDFFHLDLFFILPSTFPLSLLHSSVRSVQIPPPKGQDL